MRHALALLLMAPLAHAAAPPPEVKLRGADRKFLDGLYAFLVSPSGAERVEVPVLMRVLNSQAITRHGWQVAPGRVVGPDGGVYQTRGKPKPVDFVAACRARLAEIEGPKPRTGWLGLFLDLLKKKPRDPDPALAAWLSRLGHERLAARMLAHVSNRDEAVAGLRRWLAHLTYEEACPAFRAGADAEALAHAERYLRLYPDQIDQKQMAEVADDLKRRKKAGTFGKKRPLKPAGFERWPVHKKAAHLITALEDIDEGYSTSPPWVRLYAASAVDELVQLGDAAVPALIDDFYCEVLVALGDRRVLPEFHRRLRGALTAERRRLALACRRMGSPGPLEAFARDFEKGKLVFPEGDSGTWELCEVVNALARARLPACDRALEAMARPGHHAHLTARDILRGGTILPAWYWDDHPFCVPFLAERLDDVTPTGNVFSVKDGWLRERSPTGFGSRTLPENLKDATKRREEAKELKRDRAALSPPNGWPASRTTTPCSRAPRAASRCSRRLSPATSTTSVGPRRRNRRSWAGCSSRKLPRSAAPPRPPTSRRAGPSSTWTARARCRNERSPPSAC